MAAMLTLVSHPLCPYVQRAAIVLREKGVAFERREIDLSNKPDWFVQVSPLGKTPVLLVGDEPIFESVVICEYLDECYGPRLHPGDALERARHRGWIEFGSSLLASVAAFYSAADEAALAGRAKDIRLRLQRLEAALATGPWFAGGRFGLVDAVFGPVFRCFDVFETIGEFGLTENLPKLAAWRAQLAARPSVREAVSPHYPKLLRDFLRARGSALSERLATEATPIGG